MVDFSKKLTQRRTTIARAFAADDRPLDDDIVALLFSTMTREERAAWITEVESMRAARTLPPDSEAMARAIEEFWAVVTASAPRLKWVRTNSGGYRAKIADFCIDVTLPEYVTCGGETAPPQVSKAIYPIVVETWKKRSYDVVVMRWFECLDDVMLATRTLRDK